MGSVGLGLTSYSVASASGQEKSPRADTDTLMSKGITIQFSSCQIFFAPFRLQLKL